MGSAKRFKGLTKNTIDTAGNAAKTFPTPREWADALVQLRHQLMKERPRAFSSGSLRKCVSCSKKAVEARDDLVREIISGALAFVHHNLKGGRCRSCGTEYLEAFEEIALEEMAAERTLPDYAAKVTSVSGKNLGTYWPKDVVRAMKLHNQDALRLQLLDDDTMIIRREHAHPEE